MHKATFVVTTFVSVFLAACGGSGDDTRLVGSLGPTRAPCAGTPEPSAATHDIDLPRASGHYTRDIPFDLWAVGDPGDRLVVDVLTLDGGVLATSELALSGERRGTFRHVEAIVVAQIIPNRIRACAVIVGVGWEAEIPIMVGGGNP